MALNPMEKSADEKTRRASLRVSTSSIVFVENVGVAFFGKIKAVSRKRDRPTTSRSCAPRAGSFGREGFKPPRRIRLERDVVVRTLVLAVIRDGARMRRDLQRRRTRLHGLAIRIDLVEPHRATAGELLLHGRLNADLAEKLRVKVAVERAELHGGVEKNLRADGAFDRLRIRLDAIDREARLREFDHEARPRTVVVLGHRDEIDHESLNRRRAARVGLVERTVQLHFGPRALRALRLARDRSRSFDAVRVLVLRLVLAGSLLRFAGIRFHASLSLVLGLVQVRCFIRSLQGSETTQDLRSASRVFRFDLKSHLPQSARPETK